MSSDRIPPVLSEGIFHINSHTDVTDRHWRNKSPSYHQCPVPLVRKADICSWCPSCRLPLHTPTAVSDIYIHQPERKLIFIHEWYTSYTISLLVVLKGVSCIDRIVSVGVTTVWSLSRLLSSRKVAISALLLCGIKTVSEWVFTPI